MTILPLQTDRLRLRFFTAADDAAIHQLVFADPEVAIPFCGATRTLQQVRDWTVCRAVQATTDEFGFWAVERRVDEVLLGLVGLQAYAPDWIVWPDDPHPTYHRIAVETSYALGREHGTTAMPLRRPERCSTTRSACSGSRALPMQSMRPTNARSD